MNITNLLFGPWDTDKDLNERSSGEKMIAEWQ